MDDKNRILLIVSFGTTHPETREKTIDVITEKMATTFSPLTVRSCYTSRKVINRIEAQEGIHIDHVEEAIERAQIEGYKNIVLLPTLLMDGIEYVKMKELAIKKEQVSASIVIGSPLLAKEQNLIDTVDALINFVNAEPDTAVCLMGHGSPAEANALYGKVQNELWNKGKTNYFVGTVEGTPTLEDILPMLKKSGKKRVLLMPFMLVAGDHARNDMAGDDEASWKGILEGCGFEVQVCLQGLGEIPEIQNIYVKQAEQLLQTV